MNLDTLNKLGGNSPQGQNVDNKTHDILHAQARLGNDNDLPSSLLAPTNSTAPSPAQTEIEKVLPQKSTATSSTEPVAIPSFAIITPFTKTQYPKVTPLPQGPNQSKLVEEVESELENLKLNPIQATPKFPPGNLPQAPATPKVVPQIPNIPQVTAQKNVATIGIAPTPKLINRIPESLPGDSFPGKNSPTPQIQTPRPQIARPKFPPENLPPPAPRAPSPALQSFGKVVGKGESALSAPQKFPTVPTGSPLTQPPQAVPRPTSNFNLSTANSSSSTTKSPLQRLRTYQGDIADTIKTEETTLIKTVVAEQERKIERNEIEEPEARHTGRNALMLTLSIVLIIAGIGIVGYVYFFILAPPPEIKIIEPKLYILTVDREREAVLSKNSPRDDILNVMASERVKEYPEGTVEHLVFSEGVGETKTPITSGKLLEILGLDRKIPGPILRSIENDFVLGILASSEGDPFLILKPRDFEQVFASMLEWEKNLPYDFSPLFGFNFAIGTTTPNTIFKDERIKNKDTRVLRDTNGELILLYSFFDRNHLIISTSDEAVKEIFTRLTAGIKTVQ